MSDNDEPFNHSPREEEPPASEIGEPLPAPLATAEQGQEMESIWRMVTMVTMHMAIMTPMKTMKTMATIIAR